MKKFLVILSLVCLWGSPFYAQVAKDDGTGAEFNFINGRINDFGAIDENDRESFEFEFKNTGNQPLVISSMHSSIIDSTGPDYIIQIRYPQKPVKPGRKGTITVAISTHGKAGSFRNEIFVNSNATTGDFPLLLIGGAVVPENYKADEPYEPLTTAGAAVGAFLINNIKK